MKNTVRNFLMLFFALSIVSACKKKEDPTPPAPPEPAGVKFVHAAPPTNFGSLDLYVNNVKFNTSPFAYTQHLPDTNYRFFNPNAINVRITPAGFATSNIYQNDIGLAAGTKYTLFIHDTLSLKITTITDNLTPPAPGKAHVRFAHMAQDLQGVRLDVGTTTVANNISYPNASQFFPIDAANNQTIRVMLANAEFARLENINLIQGKIYTFWLGGKTFPPSLSLNQILHN